VDKNRLTIEALRRRNLGATLACSYALETDRDIVIAHTDADTVVDAEYLGQLSNVYKDQSVDAFGGGANPCLASEKNTGMEKVEELNRLQVIYQRLVDKYVLPDALKADKFFPGGNMSSRASVLAEIGGIPELKGAEDLIFSRRLQKAEKKIVFSEEINVHPTFRESDRTSTGHGLGVINLLKENSGDILVIPLEIVPILRDLEKKVQAEGKPWESLNQEEKASLVPEQFREKYQKEGEQSFKVALTDEAPVLWKAVRLAVPESLRAQLDLQLDTELGNYGKNSDEKVELLSKKVLAGNLLSTDDVQLLQLRLNLTESEIATAVRELQKSRAHTMMAVAYKVLLSG